MPLQETIPLVTEAETPKALTSEEIDDLYKDDNNSEQYQISRLPKKKAVQHRPFNPLKKKKAA